MPNEKDGVDIAIYVVAASVFILFLMLTAIMLFNIYRKRKNSLLIEKDLMRVQFEQTLLQSKLEIQEQTFTNISREIHDNIGQVLSLVRLNLNTIQPAGDDSRIELMDDLLGKAITDLRNLSHSLDSDLIRKIGWVKAAERLLQDIRKGSKLQVIFTADTNLPPIGIEKTIILFRMIQEIVNNIIRHADASEISFKAIHAVDGIQVDITDNGKGFDEETVTPGAGLSNLRSRSAMINATLRIMSTPGGGSTFSIFINTTTNA